MPDFPQPKSSCPTCMYEMDTSTPVGHDSCPAPGLFAFCMSCGELLVFDENLWLRLPTEKELTSAKVQDPKAFAGILRIQETIRKFMKPTA